MSIGEISHFLKGFYPMKIKYKLHGIGSAGRKGWCPWSSCPWMNSGESEGFDLRLKVQITCHKHNFKPTLNNYIYH
jgi:hypothetical protein